MEMKREGHTGMCIFREIDIADVHVIARALTVVPLEISDTQELCRRIRNHNTEYTIRNTSISIVGCGSGGTIGSFGVRTEIMC